MPQISKSFIVYRLSLTISRFLPIYPTRSTIYNSQGFTLLEILVVIGIIVVTSVVAIPTLRKFSDDQRLEAASSNIIQILRQTQSAAKTGVRCSNGKTSLKWTLDLNQNNYSLRIECDNNPNPNTTETRFSSLHYYSGDPLLVSIESTNCGPSTTSVSVVFTKSDARQICSGVETLSDTDFTLINNKNTSQTVKIEIEKSGIVRKAVI